MDVLIKNNIVKSIKVIVDIGHKYIKLIGVKFENTHAVIFCSDKIDSSNVFLDDDINAHELTKVTAGFIRSNRIRNCEVCLSLPSDMTISKIIEARNIKEKDLDKHIKNEHYNFNRVSPLTHIIDWGYLGKREENGDTVMYCLLCTTPKSIVLPILAEFTKRRLKVGLITVDFYNQICFADLFYNDFEHMNKLLVDFGQRSTKVVVMLQNIPIYCREIDVGFESIVNTIFKETGIGIPDIVDRLKGNYETDNKELEEAISLQLSVLQNEINRVIQMFEDDIVSITKIIWTGTIISDVENAPAEVTEETPKTENAEVDSDTAEKEKEQDIKTVKYDNDLSGKKLVLRGLANNTQDISKYIYKLSSMPEISNVVLSGIEEQNFNGTEKVTIFEAVLEVR